MNGIELLTEHRGRNQAPELSVFKAAVIDRLTHNLKVRLQDEDGDLLLLIESFLKFEKELDITEIHSTFAKDLSLSVLHLQYIDFANSSASVKNQSLPQLLKYFTDSKRSEQFSELTTVLARILACTPHSADCERAISANNCLKTNKRMSLSISTENNYLYVHFNMPELKKFDPRPAVVKWIESDRRKTSNSTSTSKTTAQRYFKHIFENESNAEINECEEECDSI